VANEVASAFVSLIPSAKGFKAGIQKEIGGDVAAVGRAEGRRLGGGMVAGIGGGLKGIAGPLAAAFAGVQIGSFLKGAIDEGREAAKVSALTASAIRATGGAAGISAKQVGDLASALSLKAGVDDEAIQTGANLLLTFKNVANEAGKGNDIFNQATAAALDLSAAGFGSMESASVMLGKALNDPVKGVTALQRVGVTFTAQQKEQIKSLVANGDALSAQKVILSEVMSQVGGAAAAQADPLDKASVAWGNLKEQIGTAALPLLNTAANFFTTTLLPAIQSFGQQVGPVLGRIGTMFSGLGTALAGGGGGGLTTFLTTIKTAFAQIGPSVQGFMTSLGGVFTTLKTAFMAIMPVVQQFAAQFMAVLGPGIAAIVNLFQTHLVPAFQAFIPAVTPIVKFLIGVFGGAIVGALKGALNVVKGVIKVISGILNVFTGIFTGNWKRAWDGIKQIFSGVVTAIKGAIQVFINVGILGVFRRGFALVKGIVMLGWNAVKRLFTGSIGGVLNILRRLWQNIPKIFGNALTALRNVGRNIVQGLINGIKSIGGKIKDALLGLLPGPLKKFAGMLGIDSPSKVFAGFGENIGQGLVLGVEGQRRQVERSVARLAAAASRPNLSGVGANGLGGLGSRSVTVINNYPAPERASDGLAMSLRRAVAAL
jgi:phage-related protein